jgi:hypothetical protein
MLHLNYKGILGEFSVDIPPKIICLDNRFPFFYGKVLELEIDHLFEEDVIKITNWVNYEWIFAEELLNLKYIDYERVKNIKAFI